MAGGEVSDFDACLMPALGGEGQQRADIVEGKSEFACSPDKGQGAIFHLTINPTPAGRARRLRQHRCVLEHF